MAAKKIGKKKKNAIVDAIIAYNLKANVSVDARIAPATANQKAIAATKNPLKSPLFFIDPCEKQGFFYVFNMLIYRHFHKKT